MKYLTRTLQTLSVARFKMKVMTVVGTRPEVIRLSRSIAKLDEVFDHTLVHTGQNYDYELNQIFFDDLGIRSPDYFLNAAEKTPMATVAKVIASVDKLLEKQKVDALLVLGDTNSCLAALPAKRRKIPIFHVEAGNRCFDMRVPEEINRRIIDHIADINITYSSIARQYLIMEGLPPDRIIKLGSPMQEILNFHEAKIAKSKILSEFGLREKEYFVVSSHREENLDNDENFESLIRSLNEVESKFKLPMIFSTHPRTKKKLEKTGLKLSPNIIGVSPLSFTDYNALQANAKAVLSDSGTITEEASILGFPALNIREAHERPEGMEEGSAILTGVGAEQILTALNILEKTTALRPALNPVSDYNVNYFSEKLVRIISSYSAFVDREVWKKWGSQS